jgi:hypothetical protein
VHAVPTITHVSNSGDASQTVTQGTAISAISYTASASATFTKTGSTFPSGLTVSNSGSSYTIYGTPVATGTFGYSLTASAKGCTSAAAVGTITVNVEVPQNASSTQTWGFGTQTWSDAIKMHPAACTQTSNLIESNTLEYIVHGGYYYTMTCVAAAATELCPSPWRTPSLSDFNTLIEYLRSLYQYPQNVLVNEWGTTGYARGAGVYNTASTILIGYDPLAGSGALIDAGSGLFEADSEIYYNRAFQLRCVLD